jgi:hypothetical protein
VDVGGTFSQPKTKVRVVSQLLERPAKKVIEALRP